eukprot:TRINITY_DN6704_c0_g1_i3.p1 TRINITY_DN6704_c0_g1~~TRINITY_DN6704_c0_g1_i3.p1  ORF type:complete len:324 (+),score=53.34 TRINITY_DN6704_c0_g1_i3:72-1043(+)
MCIRDRYLTTENDDLIKYEALVLAPGIQLNYQTIEGSREALDDPNSNVGSIYDGLVGAEKINMFRQTLKSGVAIFANALPPAKCASAPLKTCLLIEEDRRKMNLRNKIDFHFYATGGILFSVPEYNPILIDITKKRGINVHYYEVLTKINKDKKIATFQNAKTKAFSEVKYDTLVFSPHFKPWDAIKDSPLSNDAGLIPVNRYTLQHPTYQSVFALGDGTDLPVNKTAGAISSQSPVLVNNVARYLKGYDPNASYKGYSVCPLFTGNNKMLFTESLFGYPYHSFFTNNMKPKWIYYFISRYLMPRFYWSLLPRGRWYMSFIHI